MSVNVGTATGYLDLDISGFLTGLKSANSEATKEVNNLSTSIGKGFETVGSKLTSAGKTLTTSVTAPVVGLGTLALNASSNFESAMSQVQATMGITKDSTSELKGEVVNTNDALSDLAQTMGKETKFSASEAADAINILAMAGYDTEKIYGTLPNILNLAAAGGMGIADAADIATGVMAGFNYEADRSAEVSDKIAMLASSAKGSVQEFGVGMSTAAGQARVTGQEFDDVAVALGILGNNNLAAAEGGNALNRVLKNLYQPTDTAKTALEGLGVSAYDAQGNAKALPEVLQNLQDKLAPLTKEEYNDVMSQIFDAATMKSAPFLIDGVTEAWNLQGDSADSLIDKIKGAGDAYDGIGAAAGQAKTQMDNLSGQFTILKSALEGVAIQLGNILMPHIKKFVDKIQELVDWFANLSTEQQEQVVKFAAIAAAIGPVLLIFGKLITSVGNVFTTFGKIPGAITKVKGAFTLLGTKLINVKEGFALTKAGMSALGTQASPLGAALAGVTAPIAAIIAAIAVLVAAFVTLWKTNEEFREKMLKIWGQIKDTFAGFIDEIKSRFEDLGISFKGITDTLWAIWKGFTDLLAPLFEGAFQQISNIIKFILDVIIGVLDIFIGIFTGNWEQAWEGVKRIFSSIWEYISNTFSNVLNVMKGILDAVLGWFGTTWEETWSGIKQFFVNIWEGISSFFTNMIESIKTATSNFITSITNFFAELPKNISNFIQQAWQSVVEWSTNMVNKAKETGKNFLNNIVEFFTDLPYKIGYFIGSALANVVLWVTNMVSKAKEMGTNFLNTVVSFFTQLPGKVKQFIDSTYENVKTWATNMANKAKEMGTNFLNNVVSFFTQLPGKVKGFIDSTFENVKTWATNMANKAKEMGTNFINNVVTSMTQLPGKIKGFLDSAITNIVTWVSDMGKKGKEAATSLINGVIEGARNIPSQMASIGRDIVDGVWSGIRNARDKFVSDVKGFFSGIVDGVKDGLGISSPSKVFADEIGRWLPPGVADGFAKSMPAATKKIQTILSNTVKSLGKETDNMDASFGVEGFESKLKSLYTNVALWFESIDERIGNSINSMKEDLRSLIQLGSLVVNNDGTLGYVGYGGFSKTAPSKGTPRSGDPTPTSGEGDTFNFYSPKPIDEIEAANQLKKTKRDLSEGF